MAACGGLEQSLIVPLKPIKSSTITTTDNNDNQVPSFSELFNELYIHSSPESSAVSTPTSSISSDSSFFADSINPRTLLDTNNNIPKNGLKHVMVKDYGSFSDNASSRTESDEERIRVSKSSKRSSRRSKARSVCEFPPPISCIGISGKPLVCLKSFRQNGRIVIKEARAQNDEFMHAWRENGRLRMSLVHSDDEIFNEDDDERSSTSEESYDNVDKDNNGGNSKN